MFVSVDTFCVCLFLRSFVHLCLFVFQTFCTFVFVCWHLLWLFVFLDTLCVFLLHLVFALCLFWQLISYLLCFFVFTQRPFSFWVIFGWTSKKTHLVINSGHESWSKILYLKRKKIETRGRGQRLLSFSRNSSNYPETIVPKRAFFAVLLMFVQIAISLLLSARCLLHILSATLQ